MFSDVTITVGTSDTNQREFAVHRCILGGAGLVWVVGLGWVVLVEYFSLVGEDCRGVEEGRNRVGEN